MKSCECIEFVTDHGIELVGIEVKLMTSKTDLDFRPTYALKVRQGKKASNMAIKYCPFCGRELHEVTDETRSERQRIAKEAEDAKKKQETEKNSGSVTADDPAV